MGKTAMITGSFDPVTSGHLDLIRRSAALFDEIWVVILANTEKKSGLFTPDERLELMETAISDIPNAHVRVYGGLTSDAAQKIGAKVILRGARSATDFDYEYNLSLIMKRFAPDVETLILPTSPEYAAISSTYVRDLLKYNCPLGDSVPPSCRERMVEMMKGKK
ncbi:MAG: pantetheine-phosphate adenylyltransferase [Eubacteriales bacterium]